MFVGDFLLKRNFDINSDRLGPDCPFTHWRLYFKSTMRKICKSKFLYFADSSEFRPGSFAITCSNISIGENIVIRPGTMIFADPRPSNKGRVFIEDNVMLGSGVHIYVANHCYDSRDKDIIKQGFCIAKDTCIGKGSWIGANSILLPGVTIGKHSVVGAGSVVTKDIPDYCVAVGNPAKVIKKIGENGKY
jgi:acetyltransferase-like isoleucine patch superfamily enzyme